MKGILNEAFLCQSGGVVEKKERSESLARKGVRVRWIVFCVFLKGQEVKIWR